MPFRVTDKVKQQNRNSNVSRPGFFHLLDVMDVNFSINAFQHQLDGGTPLTDEYLFYIITDPYNMDAEFGSSPSGAGGIHVLNGKVLGTGDIVLSTSYTQRDETGITFELVFDASYTEELVTSSTGMIGTIVFNVFDKKYYGWNGTTWGDLLSDYVKSVTSVGGTITVTKGNGDQNTIDIGITAGVSGDVSNFTKELNFIGGTNADINIGTDSTTSNITFNVSRMEAGTFS